ncbi:integrase arm-type DNA-binding domain-containing protein [Bradyrhizobium sp. BRP22]|uniref:tyrosine-type recombinase/integrase n=1 Tax=Bradyrhizobium sp. BRP22 TaxID=2793821 RepID=UPI001CD5E5BE|nr:site-specific integrase [Bradyrhizobium sp. BRP22]MCA1455900.1 integrase arm-type DNA-binding domain-containing protein [Bradyrhizobium sp. BRP22]
MPNLTPRKRKGIDDDALAKLPPRKTQYRHGIGSGLYLLVKPNGTKIFRFDYSFGSYTEGKHVGEPIRKTISFGIFPDMKVGEAMNKLSDARDQLKAGRDPLAVKALGDDALDGTGFPPFRKAAHGWLTTLEGMSYKTQNRAKNMVKYLCDGVELADGTRVPGFGHVNTDQVKGSHLSPILVAFENEYETRRRLLPAARDIIAYAAARGMWPEDYAPFDRLSASKGFAGHVTESRPAIIDPKPFGELLRKIDDYRSDKARTERHVHEQIGLKLLALTFVRPGNVESAEWSEFDFDGKQWVIPAAKLKMFSQRRKAKKDTRNLVVPLSRQAVELLMELRKRTGNSRYLFPGASKAEPDKEIGMPFGRLNDALVELGYQGIHCAHGFRSSASTMLNAERVMISGHLVARWTDQKALIEVQLDHDDASTQAIYDRGGRITERTDMMQFWADKVDTMRKGAVVLPFAA